MKVDEDILKKDLLQLLSEMELLIIIEEARNFI